MSGKATVNEFVDVPLLCPHSHFDLSLVAPSTHLQQRIDKQNHICGFSKRSPSAGGLRSNLLLMRVRVSRADTPHR